MFIYLLIYFFHDGIGKFGKIYQYKMSHLLYIGNINRYFCDKKNWKCYKWTRILIRTTLKLFIVMHVSIVIEVLFTELYKINSVSLIKAHLIYKIFMLIWCIYFSHVIRNCQKDLKKDTAFPFTPCLQSLFYLR